VIVHWVLKGQVTPVVPLPPPAWRVVFGVDDVGSNVISVPKLLTAVHCVVNGHATPTSPPVS
jgi:hypothetical protein